MGLATVFSHQRIAWNGWFPDLLNCRIGIDHDRVDDILFHRHTCVHNGIGLSIWDDGMKKNYAHRSGRGGPTDVAQEVEKKLRGAGLLPERKIPRSWLNRLLSIEPLRNRAGFSIRRGHFAYLRKEEVVNRALHRIVCDLIDAVVTLDHLNTNVGKSHYLDALDSGGLLPTRADRLERKIPTPTLPRLPAALCVEEKIAGRPSLISESPPDID